MIARLLRTRLVPLAVALTGLLLATACAPAAPTGSPQAIQAGAQAPAFSLPAASGETVSLADYAGRPVLLFFHMAVG